jgi:D-alanyl-D-alanine carboxypeptidase
MAYKRSVRSLAAATAVGGMLAIAAAATPGSATAVHHPASATPDRATSAQTTARTKTRTKARTKTRAQVTAGAALQKALNQLVAMPYGPPGVIVIVQHGGRSAVYQAGTASLADRRPLSTSDHARLATFAKAYSGAVALSLVSSGKLRLNSTIGQILPALPRAWHRVTLQDVLQHRSGLPDYTKSKALRERLARYPRATIPPDQLLRYVFGKPLQFRPGSRYKYDNSDNVVAAMMAEAVTGRSYNSLLSTLVYQPAGLSQTSLPSVFRMPRPYLHGYQPEPGQAPEDVSEALTSSAAWASGGIVSTPAEMNTFIRDYLAPLFFTRQTQAAQLSFVPGNSSPPGPGTNSVGLAVFKYVTSCGTVYGHTGNTLGYTQFGAATLGGGNSVTVTANEQLSTTVHPEVLAVLRQAELLAVCAAMAPR